LHVDSWTIRTGQRGKYKLHTQIQHAIKFAEVIGPGAMAIGSREIQIFRMIKKSSAGVAWQLPLKLFYSWSWQSGSQE